MRKFVAVILTLAITSSVFASVVGGITSNDLKDVGVPQKNIMMVNKIVEDAIKESKVLNLEKRTKELEIQKLLIEGPEKNWGKISTLLDEVSKIEANMKKNKLKSQLEIKKYITNEQYKKAREIAIKRHQNDANVNIKIEKK